MRRRDSMDRKEAFRVAKIIEAAVVPDGEQDGKTYVKFKEGWDDGRVATVSGHTKQTVALLRRTAFGDIRHRDTINRPIRQLFERMAKLEQRVQDLEDATTRPAKTPLKSFAELAVYNGPKS